MSRYPGRRGPEIADTKKCCMSIANFVLYLIFAHSIYAQTEVVWDKKHCAIHAARWRFEMLRHPKLFCNEFAQTPKRFGIKALRHAREMAV